MAERRFWNEKMESLPLDEIRAIQLRKLQTQAKYVYENSPLYRKKFEDAGAKPEDIKTIEDFRNLPIYFTKDEHRQSEEESRHSLGHPFGMHLCAPLKEVVCMATTSGTTGVPTFYAFTQHDVDVTNEAWSRVFWRAGIRPGETVLHGCGLSMWVAGLPLLNAFLSMGARPVQAGAEAGTERFILFARLTKPTAMITTPSFAEYLTERAPKVAGAQVGEIGIKKMICVGEPGAGLPEVRQKLQNAWGAKIFDASGGAWGIGNVSCDSAEYNGMHVVTEDLCFYYDLVDPGTKKPLPFDDGIIGEKLITALDWRGAPAFKYAQGDLLQIFTSECPCGLPGVRMKILGRTDDMLIVKGVNVYPAAIKNIVNSFRPRTTGEMRVVLESVPPRVLPPLKVKVEYDDQVAGEAIAQLKAELEKRMADLLRFSPQIDMLPPRTLKRAHELGLRKAPLIEKAY